MSIFCQDEKLNISPAYFQPGFAFGGSCLPKDLRAFNRLARKQEVAVPLLNSIAASNQQQIVNALEIILSQEKRRIGILGFAFKAGTDDLRESPLVSLAETLLGKGYDLRFYDSCVSLARLVGANRRYINERIPHIAKLMVDSIEELIRHAELIVIGNQSEVFFEALSGLSAGQMVLDLTTRSKPVNTPAHYERLCA
jgi:GDP-mannose 6-dehydrogenase